jgi:hypothetical protein
MAGDAHEFETNPLAAWWLEQRKTTNENKVLPAGILLHPVTVAPPPMAEKAKTPISIMELLGSEERRKQINAIPLEDIDWIGEDGKAFLPAKGVVDEWRFMGMSNIQFIISGFYKAPSADDEDPRWSEGLGKFVEGDK